MTARSGSSVERHMSPAATGVTNLPVAILNADATRDRAQFLAGRNTGVPDEADRPSPVARDLRPVPRGRPRGRARLSRVALAPRALLQAPLGPSRRARRRRPAR